MEKTITDWELIPTKRSIRIKTNAVGESFFNQPVLLWKEKEKGVSTAPSNDFYSVYRHDAASPLQINVQTWIKSSSGSTVIDMIEIDA